MEKINIYIPEDLKDLIPKFIENRFNDHKNISFSLERDDFSTIKKIAHNMKGAGSGYGFDKISEIGLLMQAASEVSDKEEINNLNTELYEYLNNLNIIYTDEE